MSELEFLKISFILTQRTLLSFHFDNRVQEVIDGVEEAIALFIICPIDYWSLDPM